MYPVFFHGFFFEFIRHQFDAVAKSRSPYNLPVVLNEKEKTKNY